MYMNCNFSLCGPASSHAPCLSYMYGHILQESFFCVHALSCKSFVLENVNPVR